MTLGNAEKVALCRKRRFAKRFVSFMKKLTNLKAMYSSDGCIIC